MNDGLLYDVALKLLVWSARVPSNDHSAKRLELKLLKIKFHSVMMNSDLQIYEKMSHTYSNLIGSPSLRFWFLTKPVMDHFIWSKSISHCIYSMKNMMSKFHCYKWDICRGWLFCMYLLLSMEKLLTQLDFVFASAFALVELAESWLLNEKTNCCSVATINTEPTYTCNYAVEKSKQVVSYSRCTRRNL
jgi:hypothetical protein